MIILRQVLISIAVALLIWRIGVVGMSSHYAQSIIAGERDAVDKALTWDKRQPEALYRQALALRDDDPDTAATLLAQANAYYMADARPFFVAAEAALTQGDPTRADALVETALRLRPADPRIRQQVGEYWLLRNGTKRAIFHWSFALEAYQPARNKLFPFLLKLAENPHTRPAYEILATSPPPPGGTPFFPRSLKTPRRSKPFNSSTPCGASRGRHRSRCPNGKTMSPGS